MEQFLIFVALWCGQPQVPGQQAGSTQASNPAEARSFAAVDRCRAALLNCINVKPVGSGPRSSEEERRMLECAMHQKLEER